MAQPRCLCDEGADAVELLESLLAVAQRAAAVRRLQMRVEDEELPAAHLELGLGFGLGLGSGLGFGLGFGLGLGFGFGFGFGLGAHLQLGVHDALGRAGVQVPARREGLGDVREIWGDTEALGLGVRG